jgi:hypothetical protein
MTTLTQTWDYTCAFCDKVGIFFKNALRKYQWGRQMEANRRVAQDLMSLGLNDGKEYHYLLNAMNDKTNEEYSKEQ